MDTKPYSRLSIVLKYIHYYLTSKNKHSIHSPLVYWFADKVITESKQVSCPQIEVERNRLLHDSSFIEFQDFGKSAQVFQKQIKTIAKNSLKSKKYAQLLRGIVQNLKANKILELGTSLGITTSYLAYDPSVLVYTLEGAHEVIKQAQSTWNNLNKTNIKCIHGDFEISIDKLPEIPFDVIYIDGNHKSKPTLLYFERLQKSCHEKTVFIFDDIHYSPSMENAWKQIKAIPYVTVTIDLFFLGLVWVDKSLSKEDFELRF